MARYGRQDYDQRTPWADIPEDEPVFVLRGRDKAAPETLLNYAIHAEMHGASPALVASVRAHAQEMADYQAAHGSKVPDLG